jgi:hypothetical protein
MLMIRRIMPKNAKPINGNMKSVYLKAFLTPEKVNTIYRKRMKANRDFSIKPTGVYKNFTISTNISYVKPLQG